MDTFVLTPTTAANLKNIIRDYKDRPIKDLTGGNFVNIQSGQQVTYVQVLQQVDDFPMYAGHPVQFFADTRTWEVQTGDIYIVEANGRCLKPNDYYLAIGYGEHATIPVFVCTLPDKGDCSSSSSSESSSSESQSSQSSQSCTCHWQLTPGECCSPDYVDVTMGNDGTGDFAVLNGETLRVTYDHSCAWWLINVDGFLWEVDYDHGWQLGFVLIGGDGATASYAKSTDPNPCGGLITVNTPVTSIGTGNLPSTATLTPGPCNCSSW